MKRDNRARVACVLVMPQDMQNLERLA